MTMLIMMLNDVYMLLMIFLMMKLKVVKSRP